MWGKGRTSWKVRARPRRRIRWAGSPPMGRPAKVMLPRSGRSAPAMQLKRVVLPEPLGPMTPRISPS